MPFLQRPRGTPASTRAAGCACLLAAMLPGLPGPAWAAGIPATFHGTWVRGDAPCPAPLSLTVDASHVTFANGAQRQRFAKLEVRRAAPGRAADGALEVLADLPDGSPFLLFLTPGATPFVNLNWRPLEDRLARRFPLAPEQLKRCPAGR